MKSLARLMTLTALLSWVVGFPVRGDSSAVEGSDDAADVAEAKRASNARLRKGMRELGMWGGQAFGATTAFGGLTKPEAEGRMTTVLGLRYGLVLSAKDGFALSYVADLIPVEIQYRNVTRESDPWTPTSRATVYGAGLAPLGLKASLGRGRLKPFASAAGGVLVFGRPVPLPAATKLTFSGDLNLGVDLWTRSRRALTLGVRFHHISNAGTGDVNRGLNLFVFYGGLSFFH